MNDFLLNLFPYTGLGAMSSGLRKRAVLDGKDTLPSFRGPKAKKKASNLSPLLVITAIGAISMLTPVLLMNIEF